VSFQTVRESFTILMMLQLVIDDDGDVCSWSAVME